MDGDGQPKGDVGGGITVKSKWWDTDCDSTVSQVHEGLRKMPGEGKCEGRVWVDSAAEGTLRTF